MDVLVVGAARGDGTAGDGEGAVDDGEGAVDDGEGEATARASGDGDGDDSAEHLRWDGPVPIVEKHARDAMRETFGAESTRSA